LPFWVVFPGIVRPFADRGRLEHQDYAKGPVGWITSVVLLPALRHHLVSRALNSVHN